jgi:CBS-domain-containing membrane protein
MTTKVRTIWPGASLREAASYLRELRVSGLPVVDRHGRVIGVLSESDVVRAAVGPAGARTSVADAMSAPAIATRPEASLDEAARTMIERDVTRLPVVERGRLVGIVSRSDVVAALAVPDEELETAVRGILARLPLERGDVVCAVDAGRVELRGEVATRELAEFVTQEVAHLPGVRAVVPEIGWQRADRPRPDGA